MQKYFQYKEQTRTKLTKFEV